MKEFKKRVHSLMLASSQIIYLLVFHIGTMLQPCLCSLRVTRLTVSYLVRGDSDGKTLFCRICYKGHMVILICLYLMVQIMFHHRCLLSDFIEICGLTYVLTRRGEMFCFDVNKEYYEEDLVSQCSTCVILVFTNRSSLSPRGPVL